MSETEDRARIRKLQMQVRSLRRGIRAMEHEVPQTRAVLAALPSASKRATTTSDEVPAPAMDAFERWMATRGELPRDYLADAVASHGDPAGLAEGLEEVADGTDPKHVQMSERFEEAYAEDPEALTQLFERIQAAAQAHLETLIDDLNDTYDADGALEAEGALGTLLEAKDADLDELTDDPVVLLPVRLETRFVGPNDTEPEQPTWVKPPGLTSIDVTEPEDRELRVRVYPDAVHVDTHEPALTRQEELWGQTFWAKLWVACHAAPEDVETPLSIDEDELPGVMRKGGLGPDRSSHRPRAAHEASKEAEPTLSVDESKLPGAVRERGVVQDLASRIHKFSADASARYEEIKERAWNQLVERFGQERAAWIVHTLSPTEAAEPMLAGPEGEGPVPWEPAEAPELAFPTVPRRHASWTRPPRARLLPDRWIAIGCWRPRDEEDASLEIAHVTGSAIREPLSVGPGPQLVSNGHEDGQGHPPGLGWMTDFETAEQVGMALRFTAEDLGGHDPTEAVFERLIVVGVKASMSGEETTRALRNLLEAHHYTDGLELLQRGTGTNNTSEPAGYRHRGDPARSLEVECGPPCTSFGDLTDGDLLARALGVASPDETGTDHVFSHVLGAGRRTQAIARHTNSMLWPGTLGYHFVNLMVPNTWIGMPSIWDGAEGYAGGAAPFAGAEYGPPPGLGPGGGPSEDAPSQGGFPWGDDDRDEEDGDSPDIFPWGDDDGDDGSDVEIEQEQGEPDDVGPEEAPSLLQEIGQALKTADAFRRHFVRYVRAGGPFPPLRVGRHPYGVLPVAPLPGADVHTLDLDDEEANVPVNVGDRPGFGLPTPPQGFDVDPPKDQGKKASGGSSAGGDASGYSTTVTEPVETLADDLYGSSFDPAVPPGSWASGEDASPVTYRKALRTDHRFPRRLADWLSSLAPSWEEGAGRVPALSTIDTREQDPLDAILERRAVSNVYEEEILQGAHARALRALTGPDDGDPASKWEELADSLSDEPQEAAAVQALEQSDRNLENGAWNLRLLLQESDLPDLDPRLAWLSPFHGGSTSLGDGTPFPLVDDHPGRYLSLLHRSSPAVLDEFGHEMDLGRITVDASTLGDWFPETPVADFIGDELALYALQVDPDHGYWDASPFGPAEDYPYDPAKDPIYRWIKRTNGLAFQSSLFRQIARFSAAQAYRQARLRLAWKWDEPLQGSYAEGLLSPGSGGRPQSPIPDPSVHVDPPGTREAMQDPAPPASPYAGRTYEEILVGTCLDADDPLTVGELDLDDLGGEPPAEPRMREFLDSVAFLADAFEGEPELARRSLTETLDLASHRLDAWWTSLATRRLFEHRELSSLHAFDAEDFAFAGQRFDTEHFEAPVDQPGHLDAARSILQQAGGQDVDTEEAAQEAHAQARKAKLERARKEQGDGSEPSDEGSPKPGDRFQGGAVAGRALDVSGPGAGFTSQTAADLKRVLDSHETARQDQDTSEDAGEHEAGADTVATHVGAYGFVEDLDAQHPGDEAEAKQAEFIHAPSPQHALTAAMLRSSHKQAQRSGEEERAELLEVDLSPGRVQAAKHVLEAIRQDQMLGDVLGYRFERRLLERTQRYHQEGGDTSFNLVPFKFPLRRAFPGVEGQLEHVDPEELEDAGDGLDDEAARSDVLDGYALWKAWNEHRLEDEHDDLADAVEAFLADAEPDDEPVLGEASEAERDEIGHLLTELDAIVDAVRDLLIAESVHQIGKGNPERAGGGLDDLEEGAPVDDPQVVQTPRSDTGIAHRALVLLGDPTEAVPDPAWGPATEAVLGLDEDQDPEEAPVLQARAEAEPALEAWAGELLPDPGEVRCQAAYRWERRRDAHTGTFTPPTEPGRLTVDGLGFRPDLIVVSLVHAVGEDGAEPDAPDGCSQGVAWFRPDAGTEQRALSLTPGDQARADVHETASLLVHEPGEDDPAFLGRLFPREDGFEVEVTAHDLPDTYPDSPVVQYRAFSLGEPTDVDVGVFTPGQASIDLTVDADQLLLQAGTAQGSHAAVSLGAVAKRDGTLQQHAVATSLTLGGEERAGAVLEDRCLHLIKADDGGVIELASAEATDLAEVLELSYHTPADGSAPTGIFVALATPERVPTPAVGVLDPSDADEDGRLVEEIGFAPGAVELSTAVPGASLGGGLVRGSCTGPARQLSLSQVSRAEDGAKIGEASRGANLRLPDVEGDGSGGRIRVSRLEDSGFELDIDAEQAPAIAYRAWPAEPEELAHRVDASLTLDELDLCALDAVYLAEGVDESSAATLRELMTYHLLRHRDEKVPEHAQRIPDAAALEYAFHEAATDADGDSPITVAAFLEAASTLRRLFQEGRAVEGKDLTHPGDREGAAYTEATAQQLADRAGRAEASLDQVKALLEARLANLDPGDEPSVTEDVQRLRRRWETFREAAPVSGARTLASRFTEALDEDSDALIGEVERLAEHLPAGPLDPDTAPTQARDELTWTVEVEDREVEIATLVGHSTTQPLPDATIQVRLDAPEDEEVTVRVWGHAPERWIDATEDVTVGPAGRATATLDLAGIRPGTRLTVAVLDDQYPVPRYVGACHVAPLSRTRAIDAGPGSTVAAAVGETGTEFDVTIEPVGDEAEPLLQDQIAPDEHGKLRIDVDLVDADGEPLAPWTVLRIEVTNGGETVLETRRWIRPRPQRTLERCRILPGLLWLDEREELFDPRGDQAGADETPAGSLHEAVKDLVDWDAVREERAAMGAVNEATEPPRPAQGDLDAVDALLTDDPEQEPGLEGLDMAGLAEALETVLGPLRSLELDAIFNVTGRPDRVPGVRSWYLERRAQDPARQMRFFQLVGWPSGALEDVPDGPGHPLLGAYLEEQGVDALGEEDLDRLVAYLEPLAERLERLLEEAAVLTELTAPWEFVRRFEQLLHAPRTISSSDDLSGFKADLRRLAHRDVLETVSFIDEVIEDAGVSGPFHSLDELYPSDEEGTDDDPGIPTGGDDPLGGTTDLFANLPLGDAPMGDPITDLRVLLDRFRRELLDDLVDWVANTDTTDAPRDQFVQATQASLEAWAQDMDQQAAHLEAPGKTPRFDRSLRRGSLESVRRALHRACYFGVHASSPRSALGGDPRDEDLLVPQADEVTERIRDRLEACRSRDPEEGLDPDAKARAHLAQLEALFGDSFQILPPVHPTNANELKATLDNEELTGKATLAAETWLQRVARVREGPARFRRALSYAEALTGERHRDLTVGQLPHDPGDRWVGLEELEDPVGPGRVSLVVQRAQGALASAEAPVTGLFVDGFVENVPAPQQRTSVVLNYDDPDTEPPNSILLAMPPEGEAWSIGALRHVVLETLRLAKLRLVDLADLANADEDLPGALFPLLCFPHTDDPVPPTPSLDFDHLQQIGELSQRIQTKIAASHLETLAPDLVIEQGAWAPLDDRFLWTEHDEEEHP